MTVRATDLRRELDQLRSRRNPLDPLYRELKRSLMPESGHFDNETNETDMTGYEEILDPVATDAIDVLGAGMLGGISSPARPWFRLTTRSPELDESSEVKRWLADTQREMLMVMAKSNVYEMLNLCYMELAVFGTSCLVALPSRSRVIHLRHVPVGDFWIDTDHEGKVDTLFTQSYMTAKECVEEFGEENCSPAIRKDASMPARMYTLHKIIHCIKPRKDRNPKKVDWRNMPYMSVYFEDRAGHIKDTIDSEGQASGNDRILREEGFKVFPALVPRWTASAVSPYGRSPGMKALGIVKALQVQVADKDLALSLAVRPPLLLPSMLQSRPLDLGPGGISYVDVQQGQQVQAAVAVKPDPVGTMQDIEKRHQQIENIFYKQLFLMLQQTARYGRTAYEVEKLDKEKMMVLGPVLERLHLELLDPLIACTLQCMEMFGLIGPMPEELQAGFGDDMAPARDPQYLPEDDGGPSNRVNIEYVSVLAQAQRAAGVDAMSQFVQALAGAGQIWPEVVDNFDYDRWALTLAENLGVDPELLKTSEEVEELRAQRAQAQQAQQQLAAAQQMAATAKDVGQAMPRNGAATVSDQMSGYSM